MGKFHQILMELSAQDMHKSSFLCDNLGKHEWILKNLVYALILWRSGLGLLLGKFRQF